MSKSNSESDFLSIIQNIQDKNAKSAVDYLNNHYKNLIVDVNIAKSSNDATLKDLKNLKEKIKELESSLKINTQTNLFNKDPMLRQIGLFSDTLKEWSKLEKFDLLFDSNEHGGQTNDDLVKRILYAKNLYFINFDNNGNIFGGYLEEQVTHVDSCIIDSNAFVFSLTRKGLNNPMKFHIKTHNEKHAFHLWSDNVMLVFFGFPDGKQDIAVHKIGKGSWCNQNDYDYSRTKNALTDHQGQSDLFEIRRIVVIAMS
ncbi:TLDc domain-containing protein [Entamoeba marina]